MLSADLVGQALVPYYRQILPIFNLYITRYVDTSARAASDLNYCERAYKLATDSPNVRQIHDVMQLMLVLTNPWCCCCSNKNLGDGIDYGQQQYDCLGELISDTLALFEQRGGEDAFINIKYMVSPS